MSIETLLGLCNSTVTDILSSKESFSSFLSVAARHYKHHATNQIMIYSQAPDALLVAREKVWQQLGGRVADNITAPRIYTPVKSGTTLAPLELFSLENVAIYADRVTPFLREWTPDEIKAAVSYDNSICYAELYLQSRNAYDKLFAGETLPISRKAGAEIATQMLMHKLGLSDTLNAHALTTGYEEMAAMGAAFPKAMQWINQLTREVYTSLKKRRNEYEQSTRNVRQHGNRVPRNERAGGGERPAAGGQLTFEDLFSGGTGPASGTPVEGNPADTKQGRNSESAKRPPRADSPVPADGQPGTTGGDTAAARTDGAAGRGNESETTAVLRPARRAVESSSTPITESQIDAILVAGPGEKHGRHRLIAQYSKNIEPEKSAEYIKAEYGTYGMTYIAHDEPVSVWCTDDGLMLGKGDSSVLSNSKTFLTWPQVDTRYRQLAKEGLLYSEKDLKNALENENHQLAADIVTFYKDSSIERKDWPAPINTQKGYSHPEFVNAFENLLADKESAHSLFDKIAADFKTVKSQNYLLRARKRIIERIAAYDLLPDFGTAVFGDIEQQACISHVSDEGIDQYLVRKYQMDILRIVLGSLNKAEKAKQIAKLFGTGGATYFGIKEDSFWVDYSPKGMYFARSTSEPEKSGKRFFKWPAILSRIESLLVDGRYITNTDAAKFEHYTRMDVAYSVHAICIDTGTKGIRSLYPEYPEGYSPSSDEFEPFAKALADTEKLSNAIPVLVAEVIEYARNPSCTVQRAQTLRNSLKILRDYANGEHNIFPGYEQYVGESFTVIKEASTAQTTLFEAPVQTELRPVSAPATENLLEDTAAALPPAQEVVAEALPDDSSLGGSKTKCRKNIAAIKTMLLLEKEKRAAKPVELNTMLEYTGWGGVPEVFDTRRNDYTAEREELLALLTPVEYKQAMRTTLNAHYTPAWVIREMWAALGQMGMRGGKILDPCTGNGRFFACLPPEWKCELYGVELDSVSGHMTHNIHPQINMQITGYQDALFPDGFFDGILSNVPFGNYSVHDSRYNKYKWPIHEYFFGKSLDLVRPGGVVAFITSKYLMDKKNNSMRKYIAQRAELLGAVRLPANTFKGIANTEVTADIIILRKREKEIVPDNENWIHLGLTEEDVPVNEYYLDNPHHLLGEMKYWANMFGKETDTACIAPEDADLHGLLHRALSDIAGKYTLDIGGASQSQKSAGPKAEFPEAEKPLLEIPADPNVKNYTYAFVGEHLYYRDNGAMLYQDFIGIKLARISGMANIKKALMEVIHCQTVPGMESGLAVAQQELNHLYDEYIAEFGYLNDAQNDIAFKEDVDRPLLQSLERPVSKGVFEKSDIFSKRTIYPQKPPVVSGAEDALAASLNRRGKVDIPYMAELLGRPEQELITELGDRLYVDPQTGTYLTAEEYLSGNVKMKLFQAQQKAVVDPAFMRNTLALQKALPKPLSIGDISFSLGSPWIPEENKLDFLYELLKVRDTIKSSIYIEKEYGTTRFLLKGKGAGRNWCWTTSSEVYGTKRSNAFDIFEDCLNLQVTSVYDTFEEDGKKKRRLNPLETQLARSKQAAMQAEFSAWVLNSKDQSAKLENIYNERYNIYVPRTYDGSRLEFPGMSEDIQLRPHQKNAAARILLGGNTLLAHEVGAGKTFTMAAGGMLKRQAGLLNKSIYLIPNHMLDQWTREFYSLYPSANVLMTTRRDFAKENRQRFISRIATGEYDAIIMTFTQFERIPMSPEYRSEMIQKEIDEIIMALDGQEGERTFSVKKLEKQKANLETKLEQLADEGKKDDVLYFEQLGVDQIFVDEAHYYKNCYIYTKIQNVAGLGGTRAEKSFDILMKTMYLNEKTNSTGLVFATGTPITNSLSEMFVMQRYLQRRTLEYTDIAQFDEWAGSYATIESVLEIAPEGTGFRDRSRFTTFNNLPELLNMFHLVADVQLIEDMPWITRPGIVGGKPEVVVVPASEYVQQYIAGLAVRAEAIRGGNVDPQEDNMLLITTQGRNVAIDPRLVDENAPVNEDSKIYAVCRNILKIHKQYTAEKALQVAFQDVGIQLYPVMKEFLVREGIPAYEIAFIHDADTDKKKADLFEKCRNGDVRVLFGSTAKMGTGTNIQNRLIALHDNDCPWRPADLEQRHGRILRQGNMFKEVHIFQYITQGTFDSYLFQTIEQKQRFISQVMTNKSPARSCSDLDETVLSYSEIKALAAGDIRIREKMQLDNEIGKLQLELRSHQSSQDRIKSAIEQIPLRISKLNSRLDAVRIDAKNINVSEEFTMTVGSVNYDKRTDAGNALTQVLRSLPHDGEQSQVGQYGGFILVASKTNFYTRLMLQGQTEYQVELGSSDLGNITKIENVPDRFPAEEKGLCSEIAMLKEELVEAKEALGKPFAFAEQLKEMQEKKAALDFEIEMELSKNNPQPAADEEYEP